MWCSTSFQSFVKISFTAKPKHSSAVKGTVPLIPLSHKEAVLVLIWSECCIPNHASHHYKMFEMACACAVRIAWYAALCLFLFFFFLLVPHFLRIMFIIITIFWGVGHMHGVLAPPPFTEVRDFRISGFQEFRISRFQDLPLKRHHSTWAHYFAAAFVNLWEEISADFQDNFVQLIVCKLVQLQYIK